MEEDMAPPTREELKERIRQSLNRIGPPQLIREIRHYLNKEGVDFVATGEGFRATVDDADLVATQELRQILTEILRESFPPDA
ncbi:MAG: hypothetical protein WBP56_05685 [Polyangia bacterium]